MSEDLINEWSREKRGKCKSSGHNNNIPIYHMKKFKHIPFLLHENIGQQEEKW